MTTQPAELRPLSVGLQAGAQVLNAEAHELEDRIAEDVIQLLEAADSQHRLTEAQE